MKEIRYTLGNSPIWHNFFFEFELVNENYDDMMLAYLITQELKAMGIKESAKQVKIYNDNHQLIAHSPDITKPTFLKYTDDETNNS